MFVFYIELQTGTMPKQKKLRQWQIKKAVKNSVKRRRAQEADKDPSSWLRPGWAADSNRTDACNTRYINQDYAMHYYYINVCSMQADVVPSMK